MKVLSRLTAPHLAALAATFLAGWMFRGLFDARPCVPSRAEAPAPFRAAPAVPAVDHNAKAVVPTEPTEVTMPAVNIAPPAPIVPPAPSRWKRDMVIVPAVFNEWGRSLPFQVPSWVRRVQSYAEVFYYQRIDPKYDRIPFAPNMGSEFGVYLKFILDHYDDLPLVTVFVHGKPEAHNRVLFDWLPCLDVRRTDFRFHSVNDGYIYGRDPAYGGNAPAAIIEKCWRKVLTVFGINLAPKQHIHVTAQCCGQFAVGRDWLRRFNRSVWQAAYELIGAQRLCVTEPLDPAELEYPTTDKAGKPYVETESVPIGRHTTGGSLEALAHVTIGGLPFEYRDSGQVRCDFFKRGCPSSPCTS